MDMDITNDVSVSVEELVGNVASQLGCDGRETNSRRRERQEPPPSPPPTSAGSGLIRKNPTPKRKATGSQKDSRKKRRDESNAEIIEESEEEESLNSNDFPKEDRPELFQDDRKFNKLSYETAAKICWEHKQLCEKKSMKVNRERASVYSNYYTFFFGAGKEECYP